MAGRVKCFIGMILGGNTSWQRAASRSNTGMVDSVALQQPAHAYVFMPAAHHAIARTPGNRRS
jgi:hypothetical protein